MFTTIEEWSQLISYDANECDNEIRSHLDCENIDTESIAFTCYDCSVTVRWIG